MKSEKKQNMKQIVFLCIIFLIMLIVLGIFFSSNTAKMNKKVKEVSSMNREKMVTAVCVKKDSTLWDIATEYYTSEYEDVNELIEEIKESNGMQKDTIHEGAYIIVPYYASCE